MAVHRYLNESERPNEDIYNYFKLIQRFKS